MLCLEEVKVLVWRALSGKGRGWGAVWLGWQQALLRRQWRGCQANVARENNAPEDIFLIPGGIQVKDTVRMSCVATCWMKNSGPPVNLALYALPPSILMLTSPLLPKSFPPAQDLMFPGPAKFPHPNPQFFTCHQPPLSPFFSLTAENLVWSQVCRKRYFPASFQNINGLSHRQDKMKVGQAVSKQVPQP